MKRKSRVLLLVTLTPSRCEARSPLFNVFGSYFPGWMLCVGAAIVLAIVVRILVRRWGFDEQMEPSMLTYLALTLFFCFTLWLILFA